MSQPKRYAHRRDFNGMMVEKDGAWIKHSDYAALAAENEVLRKKVDWLMKADRLVVWNGTEWQVRHVVEQPIKPRE